MTPQRWRSRRRRDSTRPDLRIVARASTWDGAERLKAAGVTDVVRPELEGGVEIVRRTLLDLGFHAGDVQRYADTIHREGLNLTEQPTAGQTQLLDQLLAAGGGLEVTWIAVDSSSPVAGRTIGDSRLRAQTGASIVGIARGADVHVNPGPDDVLQGGDPAWR